MTAQVAECSVSKCSFNDHHEGCSAHAITVGGAKDHASCATFVDISVSGGLSKVVAGVGACQRNECVHNENLMCGAAAVHIGPGAESADCLTYQHA